MSNTREKQQKRKRRHMRIRAKVFGTAKRPRLSFFKSNKYIYGELIDDEKGVTLLGTSSQGVKGKTQIERAHNTGAALAKKAHTKKIETIVFDRGGFLYTGKVKAFAEGAREGGLKF